MKSMLQAEGWHVEASRFMDKPAVLVTFENGFSAIVSRKPVTHGDEDGLIEVTVSNDHFAFYPDTVGCIGIVGVIELLREVAEFSTQEVAYG